MPVRLIPLFLALHVFGTFLWISGLFALSLLLDAIKAEPDAAARKRLAQYARKIGMLPDIGATLAILFGLHWLFKFKLYTVPYMHIKLTLVLIVIGLHGLLRAKAKRAAEGGDGSVPGFVRPLLTFVVLAIVTVVLLKLPK